VESEPSRIFFVLSAKAVTAFHRTSMPLGILEDHKLEHVPGTAPLNELGREDLEIEQGIDRNLLKHDPTGQIVLVPQPSDSPNDPYNWSRWKKELFTVVIAYGCGCVGGAQNAPVKTHEANDLSCWTATHTSIPAFGGAVRSTTPTLYAWVSMYSPSFQYIANSMELQWLLYRCHRS